MWNVRSSAKLAAVAAGGALVLAACGGGGDDNGGGSTSGAATGFNLSTTTIVNPVRQDRRHPKAECRFRLRLVGPGSGLLRLVLEHAAPLRA
jgi:hypothetical protein